MSWRKRIRGFESIEDIEHGSEKVQPICKNNNKNKVLKDYLRESTLYPQNPQNPQNLEVESTREGKDLTPAQNIPTPSPVGLGAEYDRLWNEAWRLAEWIDNPDSAPIEKRRVCLPKLNRMRERMAEIVRQALPAGPDPETSPPGTWHTWKPTDVTRDTSPESCPARCRRTRKCYSRAYFEGKPGKVKDCEPENCSHT